jgi:transcriptional regulator with XRE-family HTH domain
MNEERSFLPIRVESPPTTLAKQLLESWKDPEYRAEFVRERVRSSVALQIRALREQRNGMTQKQLGDAIGKAQTWISVLEDPQYGKMSVATLLSLAEAFETDLEIKFRPFSRALNELAKQNATYFEVRGFTEELPDLENAASLNWLTPRGEWSDILRAAKLLTTPVAPQQYPRVIDVPSASGAIQSQAQPINQAGTGAFLLSAMGSVRLETSIADSMPLKKLYYGKRYSRRLGRLGRRNYFARKKSAA